MSEELIRVWSSQRLLRYRFMGRVFTPRRRLTELVRLKLPDATVRTDRSLFPPVGGRLCYR